MRGPEPAAPGTAAEPSLCDPPPPSEGAMKPALAGLAAPPSAANCGDAGSFRLTQNFTNLADNHTTRTRDPPHMSRKRTLKESTEIETEPPRDPPAQRSPPATMAAAADTATSALPKPLQYPASTPPELITQGAEGRLYKTTYLYPELPCALKYRLPKPYRHPVLNQRLTRQRIVAEARILAKCRREGIAVPAVYAVEEASGCLFIEWVEGEPVRASLNRWLREHADADAGADAEVKALMRRVGRAVGSLHQIGVVHGDLTTSNMMMRPARGGDGPVGLLEGEIVLIDFGLASQSLHDEDRAVDLYVLERAFGSTHPRTEAIFDELLEGYKETFKQAHISLRKLEEVRMRGRKRSMIG